MYSVNYTCIIQDQVEDSLRRLHGFRQRLKDVEVGVDRRCRRSIARSSEPLASSPPSALNCSLLLLVTKSQPAALEAEPCSCTRVVWSSRQLQAIQSSAAHSTCATVLICLENVPNAYVTHAPKFAQSWSEPNRYAGPGDALRDVPRVSLSSAHIRLMSSANEGTSGSAPAPTCSDKVKPPLPARIYRRDQQCKQELHSESRQ